jgi:hypothetical protein
MFDFVHKRTEIVLVLRQITERKDDEYVTD